MDSRAGSRDLDAMVQVLVVHNIHMVDMLDNADDALGVAVEVRSDIVVVLGSISLLLFVLFFFSKESSKDGRDTEIFNMR